MKRVGCWIGGAALAMAVAGCGGGGGKTLSDNTNWQLYSQSSQSFTPHVINGVDGEYSNMIDCRNDGSTITIEIVDAGEAIDYERDGIIDVPARKQSTFKLTAGVADPTRCAVEVEESALGPPSPSDPVYKDACAFGGGSCQMTLSVDEAGKNVSGTVSCSKMAQTSAPSAFLELGAARTSAGSGRGMPMQFNIQNCK